VAHYRLLEVADGVHAAIDVPGGGAAGNAAIVDLWGTTLVFDTGMTPQAGAELRRAAEEVAPVSVVVNSHWHADLGLPGGDGRAQAELSPGARRLTEAVRVACIRAEPAQRWAAVPPPLRHPAPAWPT
jgi:Metallo-beta-lactamase superfamily